jgi:hypothetical protein
MLTLALTYSVIYLGPWGFLKDWANITESGNWGGFLTYVAALWGSALVLVPGSYYLAAQLGRRLARAPAKRSREVFLSMVYPLVPLGLLAWAAFSIPLLLANGSYILMTLSDPFGWGWDLFGTGHIPWTPVLPHWTPYVQVPLLLAGLYFALKTGYGQVRRLFESRSEALRAFAPVSVLLTVIVGIFLHLYVG